MGRIDALQDHRKRNGDLKKTTEEENELLIASVKENPFSSIATTIRKTGINISVHSVLSVIRRLKAEHITSRKAVRKIALTEEPQKNRFCKTSFKRTQEEQNTMIWMDEKIFASSEEGRRKKEDAVYEDLMEKG